MSVTNETAPEGVTPRNWLQGFVFDDILPAALAFKYGTNPNSQLSPEQERYAHYYGPEAEGATQGPQFRVSDFPSYTVPALGLAALGIVYLIAKA